MPTPIDRLNGDRALLRFLQRQGRLSTADAARFEQAIARGGLSVNEVLEREGVINEKNLAILLSETLRLPLVDLSSFPLDSDVTKAVKEAIATKYEIVPLRLEERLIEVATANPLNLDALRAVGFAMGRRVQAAVATRLEIHDALTRAYRLEESPEQFLETVPETESLTIATDLVDTIALPRVNRTFKALVVDDDPDLRRIVRMTLERSDLGLTVITAQDGTEGLALADLERPDIVILDLSMPGVDGLDVCHQLRAEPGTASVPVMMLTARDNADSVTRGFREGADDYVAKPFRREDLIARVRRMIERTYGPDATAQGQTGTPAPPVRAAGAGD